MANPVFNSVVVFWPLLWRSFSSLHKNLVRSFPVLMSHLSMGKHLLGKVSFSPVSSFFWLPWIFLFVFVFSFLSPWGHLGAAEWPEVTDAPFAFQTDWSYRGYSSLCLVYLWGSKEKDSGFILDSGLCSLFVSHTFLYLSFFFFFFHWPVLHC